MTRASVALRYNRTMGLKFFLKSHFFTPTICLQLCFQNMNKSNCFLGILDFGFSDTYLLLLFFSLYVAFSVFKMKQQKQPWLTFGVPCLVLSF